MFWAAECKFGINTTSPSQGLCLTLKNTHKSPSPPKKNKDIAETEIYPPNLLFENLKITFSTNEGDLWNLFSGFPKILHLNASKWTASTKTLKKL